MTTNFFAVDDEDVVFLKSQWDDVVVLYASNTTIKEDAFQALKGQYLEESRFYHNLSHVKSLLTLFESLKDKIQDRHAVRFSIWLHDAIYDPKRNDNEAESARFASEMLGTLRVHVETTKTVQDLILATKHHDGADLSQDAKLFLDMDLAILGASEEIYREYSQAIRKEYDWVSESAYREGRQKVLKSFIERDKIYFIDEMQARYERQARKNIHAEIQALESNRN